jgi:hypothetical protein
MKKLLHRISEAFHHFDGNNGKPSPKKDEFESFFTDYSNNKKRTVLKRIVEESSRDQRVLIEKYNSIHQLSK